MLRPRLMRRGVLDLDSFPNARSSTAAPYHTHLELGKGSEDILLPTPAMSGRKLGGGRILGSGRSLAPPAPPAHQRTSSLISPSESTLSLDSQASASPLATSPTPDNSQDLSSRVSLENGGASAVAAASSKLLCPICNEEMVGSAQRTCARMLTGSR